MVTILSAETAALLREADVVYTANLHFPEEVIRCRTYWRQY